MVTSTQAIEIARQYIGTPFHHQGRVKGEGIDCVGLLICVFKDIGIVPLNWDSNRYETRNDGIELHKTLLEFCYEIPLDKIRPGDIVTIIVTESPQHLGLISNYGIIQCIKKVSEHRITERLKKRFHKSYRVRGLIYG